jgi:hypothetical protein
MSFKDIFFEGRDKWSMFSVNKGSSKWTFKNTESNTINYLKVNPLMEFGTIQRFLKEIEASQGTPKTSGEIDYYQFASDVVSGKKPNIYVKSSMFEKIKNTWFLDI